MKLDVFFIKDMDSTLQYLEEYKWKSLLKEYSNEMKLFDKKTYEDVDMGIVFVL